MARRAGVRIIHNRVKATVQKVAVAVDKGVRETAFEVLEDSQNNIREQDAVDTGALLNGGYVETSKHSGRDSAIAKAKAEHEKGSRKERRKKGKKKKQGELAIAQASEKPRANQAKIAYTPDYSLPVETGSFRKVTTYGHKGSLKVGRESTRVEDKQFGTAVPPRPFLMPAAEKARVWLPERIAAQIKKAVG